MGNVAVAIKLQLDVRILSVIRDQRTKNQGNKKSCETREVPYTCKYTSGYLIPNSVLYMGPPLFHNF